MAPFRSPVAQVLDAGGRYLLQQLLWRQSQLSVLTCEMMRRKGLERSRRTGDVPGSLSENYRGCCWFPVMVKEVEAVVEPRSPSGWELPMESLYLPEVTARV